MNSKPSPDSSGPKDSLSNKRFLMRYAALGTQLLAAIAIGVFVGLKADKWLHTSPLLACVLPLLILSLIFYKLFRETSKKKTDE
jgi:F0F1-type ATP synthase assembly protein I